MKNLRSALSHVRPSWRALVILWREEFSFRVQVGAAVCALVLSFLLHLSEVEFLVIILLIGAVLATEALNTAIEELCDHVTPDQHPKIGKIKDLGSGASLLLGIAGLVIGLVVFIPHLMQLL
jgi:diacylglycerol kinase